MLDAAMIELGRRMSKHYTDRLGEPWLINVIGVAMEDASIEPVVRTVASGPNPRRGYIRLNTVTIGLDNLNRRAQRLEIRGTIADSGQAAVISLIPVAVTVDVKLNLYDGRLGAFRLVAPTFEGMLKGEWNFNMQLKVGDTVQPCNVQVMSDQNELTMPEMPVELTDEDMPSLEFTLTMKNLFSIINTSNIPVITGYDYRLGHV